MVLVIAGCATTSGSGRPTRPPTPFHSCSAPTREEVSAKRSTLDDFLVIRTMGPRLVAQVPTDSELDDYAYFLAAIEGTGQEIGASEEHQASYSRERPREDQKSELSAIWKRIDRAATLGRDGEVIEQAEAYLHLLGWPGRIASGQETDVGWGHSRYSEVMRILAREYRKKGRLDEAVDLLRRSDPGGGPCGTGYAYVLARHIEEVIDVEEQRGTCRAAVPGRLWSPQPRSTDVLRQRGFDVPRLYRGALVTLGRPRESARPPAQSVREAGAPGIRAIARLDRLGREIWWDRVRAIEGFAIESGKDAVDELALLAARPGPAYVTGHALAALKSLVERGSCHQQGDEFVFTSGGDCWPFEVCREVEHLACEAMPSDSMRESLVHRISILERHPSVQVRETLASALEAMGTPSAVPILERLAKDPTVTGTVTDDKGQRPYLPIADRAREALERLRDRKGSERSGTHGSQSHQKNQ